MSEFAVESSEVSQHDVVSVDRVFEISLFILALFVYLFTRLNALEEFPIYFFCDEAVQTVLADDLLRNDLRDFQGTLLPAYFKNDMLWNLSLSVYIHALTVGLFGKSIFITRATSAVVSLLGAAAVGLILKLIFKSRYWWSGVLFMAITPAWFLHSRTAFETVMMVSFYACFLLCYLLYRHRAPRYLYAALLFGAATFYAYTNGQAVMAATGLLLFISDFKYHWRNRRTLLIGVAVAAIIALPYFRFQVTHPDAVHFQFRKLDSYLFKPIPLADKLTRFRDTYLRGLSPRYWFFPHKYDMARHRMKGYGHIHIATLPLFLIGAALSLWRFRSSEHRTLLIACLAAPIGAATVQVGITRVLAFIVPTAILTSLGLDWLVSRFERRITPEVTSGVIFAALTIAAYGVMNDALTNGALWFRDYGLGGMQWGARPLFTDIVPDYLRQDERNLVMLTPTWTNGTTVLARFFLSADEARRAPMYNVDYFLSEKRALNDHMLHVMTAPEYERALDSDKFSAVKVKSVLHYPDGSPGFYFVRLAYVDNIDDIFAAEREARRQLVENQLIIDGEMVTVRHSLLDAGRIYDIFDDDTFTLGRVMEANPAVFELIFPEPRAVAGLAADFGSFDFKWDIKLYSPNADEPVVYTTTHRDNPPDPHIEIAFGRGPAQVSKMRIEILDLHAGDRAKIHIRELQLRFNHKGHQEH